MIKGKNLEQVNSWERSCVEEYSMAFYKETRTKNVHKKRRCKVTMTNIMVNNPKPERLLNTINYPGIFKSYC